MKKATTGALESWLRKNEHKPVRTETYKGHHIYLSVGGPYFDSRKLNDYPLGWYEAAYAIGDGDKIVMIQVVEFDKLHDKDLTEQSREIGRANAAKVAAINFLDDLHETSH